MTDPLRPPETDEEPWNAVLDPRMPDFSYPWHMGAESRRLSLRVLILCGAALVTIAAIAWVTTGGSPK